jgi:DNA-binding LacI/PurR family transcriptional regulator/signal transduction histidine kinase
MLTGHHPHMKKSKSKSKSRTTIAFITYAFYGDPNSFSLWSGIYDTARERGLNLICLPANPPNSPIGFEAQANVLYNLVNKKNIDGLIIWGAGISVCADPVDVINIYVRFNEFPKIIIGHVIEGTPSIIIDNYAGMFSACIHLIKKHQCSQIAFIRGPETHTEAELRYSAYKDALVTSRLPFEPDLVVPGNFKKNSGNMGIKILLDERKVKFDAVVTANDLMSIGAVEELHDRGILIPEDVKLAGFDDIEESRYIRVPLTTVKQPFYDMGKMAVKNLLLQIHNNKIDEKIIIPAELIERESCGCLSSLVVQVGQTIIASGNQQKNISEQKNKILSEIMKTLKASTIRDSVDKKIIEDILNAFIDDIMNREKRDFLSIMNRYLISLNTKNEFDLFHFVLSSLRQSMLPVIANNVKILIQAENLWQQCRILIGEYSQRMAMLHGLQEKVRNEILHEINQRLVTTFDIEELMNITASELPRLGIPGCFLSLYNSNETAGESSRLMLAYIDKQCLKIDSDKRCFPTINMVPDGLLPGNMQYTFIVEPLYFRNEQLGFVIFEEGPKEGSVYDALRTQLSVAIKGAFLFQEREKLLSTLESHARQLEDTAENLARSNSELEQFSYIASHDLKEPLRKISTFGKRLKEKYDKVLGDQGCDYIDRMQNASIRMQALIDDLLTYSRLTYKIQQFTAVNLYQVAKDVLIDLDVLIEQKKARIEMGELPVIDAEPLQMRQLLQNLICNALKFDKPDHPPVIKIYGKITEDLGIGFCEIIIEDNGIGIEEKYFDQIFGVFQRLHGHTQYTGTGIGLAICKKIVGRHKGKIRVESILGEGTKFIVTLPVKQYT